MKTFNSGEKSLMAQLGITTLKEMEMIHEGWEESSFECRANGIRTMSFDKYLEIRLIWRKATWSKL